MKNYDDISPPYFAGVKRWARYHRRNRTQRVLVKGNPLKYLNASRTVQMVEPAPPGPAVASGGPNPQI